jgi:hypothetical protein
MIVFLLRGRHNVKFQNYYWPKISEHQKCLFSSSLLQQSEHRKEYQNKTFDVLMLPSASKKITTSKIKNINYLCHITYGYQGLWGPWGLG